MPLYIVSMSSASLKSHSTTELTDGIEALPGIKEIVTGRNRKVLTVQMPASTAALLKRKIPFADVEDYYELNLL